MYREKTIGVVVPAYNEELLIGRVIDTMPEFVDKIIIIDDKSTDKTAEIVEEYISKQPDRITLIKHDKNQGVGGAIVTGYQYARETLINISVVMGGDAQMNPDDMPSLLDPVVEGKVDYAKGNRLFTGEAWNKIPRIRYLGNSALSLMTKVVSGYWHVADSQTGYTAISLKALQTLPLEKVFKRYGMPNDMLTRLNVYDFRVVDVPVEPVYGIGEKSGIRYGRAMPQLTWLLFSLFLWRMKEKYIIRDCHPLLFFYLMGFTCAPIGFVYGVYLIVLRLATGPIAPTSALFAAFLFLSGLQAIFFGMWMDMQHSRQNGF